MILGKIIGKSTTNSFKFLAKGEVKKFQYVQVLSKEDYVLGQIIEIEKTHESIAECILIGYREQGILKSLRIPLEPGSEVLEADDNFIQKTLGLEQKEGVFIGHLEDRENVKVYLDFNTLLTKHITILAKSGSGKSYLTGVLLEEFLEKKIPLVVIDPHGEYSSLKYPNDSEKLIAYGLKPKGYLKQIQEFTIDETGIPLRLNNKNLEAQELIHLLPAKLSSIQLGILYSALHHLESIDFESLKLHLDMEESNAKWTLINIIEYVENLHLFSDSPTPMEDLVQVGKASLINLMGVKQELQEIVVYKLLKDLFLERKKGNIPPFFLVLEEAHAFVPERNFGEAKSSSIIRQIFSEGRKFGLSVCLISQRPSRVDKSALAMATTQIVLKITNPHDVRAVTNSMEGITMETEKEIKNLSVGSALLSGVLDTPLFVTIRPRRSKHGGSSVTVVPQEQEGDLLPLIRQRISVEDMKFVHGNVKLKLIPCGFFRCFDTENFNLIVNLHTGEIIQDIETLQGVSIKNAELSVKQDKVFQSALRLKKFSAAELFERSGLQFSEIYETLKILTEKGYLVKEKDLFNVSKIFDLSNLKFYGTIEYGDIAFDEKLEERFSLEEMRNKLSKYVEVKEKKQCWLVAYI